MRLGYIYYLRRPNKKNKKMNNKNLKINKKLKPYLKNKNIKNKQLITP